MKKEKDYQGKIMGILILLFPTVVGATLYFRNTAIIAAYAVLVVTAVCIFIGLSMIRGE